MRESYCTIKMNMFQKAILKRVEPRSYRCININPNKKIWVLTDKQKEHVRNVCLSHLSEIDYMRIDHALISRLVERWMPETNTFHLPMGEATITLEDVAYIYSLTINGEPITRRTFNNACNAPTLYTKKTVKVSKLALLHGKSENF